MSKSRERGASSVEYVVLIGFVGLTGYFAAQQFQSTAQKQADDVRNTAVAMGDVPKANVSVGGGNVENVGDAAKLAGQTLKNMGEGMLNPANWVDPARPLHTPGLSGLGGGGRKRGDGEPEPPPEGCRGDSCTGPKCFVAGTLILTERGLEPIESVRVGERVLARDDEGDALGELGWKPVVQRFERVARALVRLEVESEAGESEAFDVTPEHPIFALGRGWVAAQSLEPGRDVLIDVHNQRHEVKRGHSFASEVAVYNLEVADFHSYFVGREGVWAHNGCGQSKPQQDPPPDEHTPLLPGDRQPGHQPPMDPGTSHSPPETRPPTPGPSTPTPYDPRSDPRWNDLSQDPAHNGKVTENSKTEADIGLSLEHDGRLPGPIVRDPTGASEFIDANGQHWDVKSPQSYYPGTTNKIPPKKGGFTLDPNNKKNFQNKVDSQLQGDENVIINTQNMDPADAQALKDYAASRSDWTGKVIFYP
jgi:hypothetical protein